MKVQSQLEKVVTGVPQGSTLFICYLKNMASPLQNIPEKNLCLFAED